MELPVDLVDPVAIRAALDEELYSSPRLLPRTFIDAAFMADREAVFDWVHRQLSGRYSPAFQEVVAASKARHGIRPVAVWDLPSRVLYRSLAARLQTHLEPPDRVGKSWRDFQRKPLEIESRYIVSADIASCYQLIDHGLLSQELLVRTGEHDTVEAAISLLQETSGRKYGIPQQSAASDLIADAFLDRLERALVRRGLVVTRYNDDFRVNCDSWSAAIGSIEILSEEASRLGLVLNDSKTLTWTYSKYREHQDRDEELRQEIAEEAEIDLTQARDEEYEPEVLALISSEHDDEVEALSAVKVLERWNRIAGKGRVADKKRVEYYALLQLIPLAFSDLSDAWTSDPEVIETCMRMLRYEQTMTPPVCRYLTTLHGHDQEMLASFDKLLRGKAYFTGWQSWWLQQPLSKISGLDSGVGSVRRLRWLSNAYRNLDHSPVLRAHAAVTLARLGQVDSDELLRVYDRTSPVVRPVIAGAIGLLKPNSVMRKAVTSDSKLDELAFKWGVDNA